MNKNAQEALAKYRAEKKESGEAVVRRNPVEKLIEKPTSRSTAIEAMCWVCMGSEPGSKRAAAKCTSYSCPLYIFRPGAIDTDVVVWKDAASKQYCGKEEEE